METKIRECPYCHQQIEIKSPWQALWRKPTLNEWINLFIIVMILFIAWAYRHDTQVCRDYIGNLSQICAQGLSTTQTGSPQYSPYDINMNDVPVPILNITDDINIINDTNVTSNLSQ